MRDLPWLIAIIGGAVAVAVGVASGWVAGIVVTLIGLGVLGSAWIGSRVAIDVDRAWLTKLLPLAFILKLVGSGVRYFVLVEVYGRGDAFEYHEKALAAAPVWRDLELPEQTIGGFGTQVTSQIAGIVYAILPLPMIGAFLLFALLSFIGMLCFYLAFRSTMPRWGALPYFVLLFFMPTMLFWPSSLGKDALIIFGLGVASLGIVKIFSSRFARGAWFISGGGLVVGLIRPHVLVILIGSVVVAVVFTRAGQLDVSRAARAFLMIFVVVVMAFFVPVALAQIGANEGLEAFLTEQQQQTAQGGSAVVGEPATSPLQLPEATIRVLFRPLVWEASTPMMAFSALEGLAVLVLLLWTLPTMWSNRQIIRRSPYMLVSLAFCAAFVVAFSSVFNLGILARQRAQVVPFLLVVLVGLGWRKWSNRERAAVDAPPIDVMP